MKCLIIAMMLFVITSCSNQDVILDRLEGFYPMRFQKINEDGGSSISLTLPFNQNNLAHFAVGNIKAKEYLNRKVDDNPVSTGAQPIRVGIMELIEWENSKVVVHASLVSSSDEILVKYFVKNK